MHPQNYKRESRGLEYFLSALSVSMLVAVCVLAVRDNPQIAHFRFNFYAILAAVAIVANTVLLAIINARRGKISNSFWFSMFLGALIYWGVTQFFQYLSADGPSVIFWAGMTNIGGTFVPVIGLLFVISYTRPKLIDRAVLPWLGIFFTALLIHSVAVTTPVFEELNPAHYRVEPYGLQMVLNAGLWLWYAWIQIMLLSSAVLLVQYHRKQTELIEKQRSRIFMIGALVVVVAGSVTDVFFPLMHIFESLPRMALLLTTVMAAFFTYGLLRYKLFIINPATVAPNILATMAEAVVVTDREYRILFTNLQAERLLGNAEVYRPGALFLQAFQTDVSSQMKQRVEQALNDDVTAEFDDVVLLVGGKPTVSVDVSVSNITDEDDIVSGIVWVFNDISKLKDAYSQLAEEKGHIEQKVIERTKELQVEHARLKTSVENLPVGFFMTDANDQIVTYNKTALKTLEITDDKTMHQRLYQDLGLVGAIAACKKQRRTLDVGEVAYGSKSLHISISPILYEDSAQTGGVVILLQDVTQAKQLEEERKQFIMTSSHEMRTPVAIIEAALSTAANPNFGALDPKSKVFVDKAYQQARHLGALFHDLESAAALVNGDSRPAMTTFDIVELAREVANSLEPSAKQRALDLRLTCPPHSVEVMADMTQIREVITKIVENAIKFTDTGYVEVAVEADASQAVIRVTDTGVGIGQDDQAKLFKQFGRVDSDFTREFGGTGLGLYIAYSLVQLNGGRLSVDSMPGKGSVFSFTLARSDKHK